MYVCVWMGWGGGVSAGMSSWSNSTELIKFSPRPPPVSIPPSRHTKTNTLKIHECIIALIMLCSLTTISSVTTMGKYTQTYSKVKHTYPHTHTHTSKVCMLDKEHLVPSLRPKLYGRSIEWTC